MPTARQIDELEETLRTFHDTNHAGSPLEHCSDLKCLEARLSIAWLRVSIRERETEKEKSHRKTA